MEILGNERQTVPRAVARLPAVIGAASDCLPCHWDVSVSCKNIRLSSDVANPLSRSRNSWADGDGCVGFAPDAGVAAAAASKV